MRIAPLLALPLLLIGCSETKEALGLGKNVPDEFVVLDRAPLALPPNFNLRPPQPGAPRPQDVTPTLQAERTVLGATTPQATPEAGALEQQLLTKAAADKADPNIRKTVEGEALQDGSASRHLVDDLLWWQKPENNSAVVDPAAEAARLRANQTGGKPANAGPTPTVEKRKSGWLW